jgi:hypothetical protein
MRTEETVSEEEFLELHRAWLSHATAGAGIDDHQVGLEQFRVMLSQMKGVEESDLDLLLGLLINEDNRILLQSGDRLITQHWLGEVQSLFFTLDTPGYGSLGPDETALLVLVLSRTHPQSVRQLQAEMRQRQGQSREQPLVGCCAQALVELGSDLVQDRPSKQQQQYDPSGTIQPIVNNTATHRRRRRARQPSWQKHEVGTGILSIGGLKRFLQQQRVRLEDVSHTAEALDELKQALSSSTGFFSLDSSSGGDCLSSAPSAAAASLSRSMPLRFWEWVVRVRSDPSGGEIDDNGEAVDPLARFLLVDGGGWLQYTDYGGICSGAAGGASVVGVGQTDYGGDAAEVASLEDLAVEVYFKYLESVGLPLTMAADELIAEPRFARVFAVLQEWQQLWERLNATGAIDFLPPLPTVDAILPLSDQQHQHHLQQTQQQTQHSPRHQYHGEDISAESFPPEPTPTQVPAYPPGAGMMASAAGAGEGATLELEVLVDALLSLDGQAEELRERQRNPSTAAELEHLEGEVVKIDRARQQLLNLLKKARAQRETGHQQTAAGGGARSSRSFEPSASAVHASLDSINASTQQYQQYQTQQQQQQQQQQPPLFQSAASPSSSSRGHPYGYGFGQSEGIGEDEGSPSNLRISAESVEELHELNSSAGKRAKDLRDALRRIHIDTGADGSATGGGLGGSLLESSNLISRNEVALADVLSSAAGSRNASPTHSNMNGNSMSNSPMSTKYKQQQYQQYQQQPPQPLQQQQPYQQQRQQPPQQQQQQQQQQQYQPRQQQQYQQHQHQQQQQQQQQQQAPQQQQQYPRVATLSLTSSSSGSPQFASRTPTRGVSGRNMNGERSSVRRRTGSSKQGGRGRGRGRSDPVVHHIQLQ